MALTAPTTPTATFVPGARRHVLTPVSADNSYPPGGYTVTPALFNLQSIDWWVPLSIASIPVNCTEAGKNASTGKLQFMTSTGAEVAGATSLTGTSVYILAAGV